MDNFYSNCSIADNRHLRECDCCDKKINSQLLIEAKQLINDDTNDDDALLLRQVKSKRSDIRKSIGEENAINNVRCVKETNLVNTIIENFKSFDLNIPTYAMIVSSVVNQALLSYRLSNLIGKEGLKSEVMTKDGNILKVPSPFIDISSKVDKLIIDACDKMHKLKFGEKHVNENISNKPKNISELFDDIIEVENE